MNEESKEFYKSKLFWMGILQLGIAVASYIDGNIAAGVAITTTGVLTTVFRFVTTQSIK